jgi:hypothetical protein
MRFELEKHEHTSGLRSIEITTTIQGQFFGIDILKDSSGEISAGNFHYGEHFYDAEASIEQLKCLHEMTGEALRVANNFEKYWRCS